MNNPRIRLYLALALGLAILLSSVAFCVTEGRVAVVTRFGAPVRVYSDAGLHLKWPLPFEQVNILDARERVSQTQLTETLTRDRKNIIMVTYSIWKIADPIKFMQAVGDTSGAEMRLDGVVTNAKNAILGNYDLSALVSDVPGEQKIDDIENDMLTGVQDEARYRYGIELMKVGIQRLALPEANSRYVFDQMRAERAQYAARYRAEGEEAASKIKADTDLKVAELRAEGAQKSEEIRGTAEAEAARIYASAHKLDPEFYRFIRSLDSMNKILGDKSTIVFDTNSAPFDILKSPDLKGGRKLAHP